MRGDWCVVTLTAIRAVLGDPRGPKADGYFQPMPMTTARHGLALRATTAALTSSPRPQAAETSPAARKGLAFRSLGRTVA
jgi:hypothetical protein